MPRRYTPALVALIVLAACDGGASDNRHALVGSWLEAGGAQTTFVTSSVAQEVVDATRPGTGDLALRGDASDVLVYASSHFDREGRRAFTIFSTDHLRHPFPSSYAFLSLDPDGTSATVWRDGAYRQYGYTHYGGPVPYTFADGRLVLDDVALSSHDGRIVVADGALTLPMRTLPAGVETEVQRHHHTEEPGEVLRRRVFGADGSYREERVGDSPLPPFSGTWEDLGDGHIRITGSVNGQAASAELAYRVEGGRLTLSTTWEPCAGVAHPDCLPGYERGFAMAPGSLVRMREENAEILAPAPAGGE
jgi:hypothetical protein